MNPEKPYAVITIYECYGDHNYLIKIGKSPDTEQAKQLMRKRVSKAGKPVVFCANFEDVLKRSLRIVVDVYEEIQRKRYRGDWFIVENGKLVTNYLRRTISR